MDRDFWLARWEDGRIGFHWHLSNPLLVAHFGALALRPRARIFVPLCGKTVDIGWLRARGFRSVGVELSPIAVEQLFDGLGEAPEITQVGPLRLFSARDVAVFQGDIFDLTPERLGEVDAVYDRAALIALPPPLRRRYAAHLQQLTGTAPQLLVSYENGRDPDDGPPFPVTGDDIRGLYGSSYRIDLLEDVPDGEEHDLVWHLRRL